MLKSSVVFGRFTARGPLGPSADSLAIFAVEIVTNFISEHNRDRVGR